MIAIQRAEDIKQLIGCRIVGAEWKENSPSITIFIENNEEQRQALTISAQGGIVIGNGGVRASSTLVVQTHQPS